MNRYFWGLLALSLVTLLGQHIYLTGKATKLTLEISAMQRAAATARATAEEAARKQENDWKGKLAETDAKWNTELKRLVDESQSRIDAIRNGTQRVYVNAKCPAPGGVSPSPRAPGLDVGTVQAELDPTVAAEVVRITDDGDQAIVRLNALQDYVQTVLQSGPAPSGPGTSVTPRP